MANGLVSVHDRLLGRPAEAYIRQISLISAIIGLIVHLLMWIAYQTEIISVSAGSASLLDLSLIHI